MEEYLMTIGGEEVQAKEWVESVDPFAGSVWAKVPRGGKEEADAAVYAAQMAFEGGPWHEMTAAERGKLLCKLGDLIPKYVDKLGEIESRDNGKLLKEMRGQVAGMANYFHYFGGLADKIEGSVPPIGQDDLFGFTGYEPLGVCVAITAWNSPLMLAAWKLAPALAAGNTVVIKPSEFASCSTLRFARLFEEAGFPPGVVNVVSGYGSEIGEALVTHPDVAKVSFTGGDATGAGVYASAAKDLKHVTLELGGKSPNIVFADADLDNAVKGVVSGIFAASGQTCIAGSRLLVEKSIHDEFVKKLVAFTKRAKMGDPKDPKTNIGPISNAQQFEKVTKYIDIAKEEGAKCVCGGKSGPGLFVEPTIFTNVTNQMRIAREEVFGPILTVIPFTSEEEAIHLANDTKYGLAAGVWTTDPRKMHTLPKKLAAGTVWVNTYRCVNTYLPFGGYKHSGLGRENGKEAIYAYLQPKATWISTKEVPDPFVMNV